MRTESTFIRPLICILLTMGIFTLVQVAKSQEEEIVLNIKPPQDENAAQENEVFGNGIRIKPNIPQAEILELKELQLIFSVNTSQTYMSVFDNEQLSKQKSIFGFLNTCTTSGTTIGCSVGGPATVLIRGNGDRLLYEIPSDAIGICYSSKTRAFCTY